MLGRIQKTTDAPTLDVAALLAAKKALYGDTRMEAGSGGDGGDGGGDDGGSGGDDGNDDGDAGGDDGDDEDKLDDAGKRALTAERDARAKAERAARPWQKIAKDFGVKPAEVRALLEKQQNDDGKGGDKDGNGGDDKVDADAIRREAERDATSKANARLVRAGVRELAADLFQDPADAVALLDLSSYEVDDDGELEDQDAVKADMKDLLKRKPHLSKKTGPKPDKSQGGSAGGGRRDDVGPGLARLQTVQRKTT